jgi:hypothetical protein
MHRTVHSTSEPSVDWSLLHTNDVVFLKDLDCGSPNEFIAASKNEAMLGATDRDASLIAPDDRV